MVKRTTGRRSNGKTGAAVRTQVIITHPSNKLRKM